MLLFPFSFCTPSFFSVAMAFLLVALLSLPLAAAKCVLEAACVLGFRIATLNSSRRGSVFAVSSVGGFGGVGRGLRISHLLLLYNLKA